MVDPLRQRAEELMSGMNVFWMSLIVLLVVLVATR